MTTLKELLTESGLRARSEAPDGQVHDAIMVYVPRTMEIGNRKIEGGSLITSITGQNKATREALIALRADSHKPFLRLTDRLGGRNIDLPVGGRDLKEAMRNQERIYATVAAALSARDADPDLLTRRAAEADAAEAAAAVPAEPADPIHGLVAEMRSLIEAIARDRGTYPHFHDDLKEVHGTWLDDADMRALSSVTSWVESSLDLVAWSEFSSADEINSILVQRHRRNRRALGIVTDAERVRIDEIRDLRRRIADIDPGHPEAGTPTAEMVEVDEAEPRSRVERQDAVRTAIHEFGIKEGPWAGREQALKYAPELESEVLAHLTSNMNEMRRVRTSGDVARQLATRLSGRQIDDETMEARRAAIKEIFDVGETRYTFRLDTYEDENLGVQINLVLDNSGPTVYVVAVEDVPKSGPESLRPYKRSELVDDQKLEELRQAVHDLEVADLANVDDIDMD